MTKSRRPDTAFLGGQSPNSNEQLALRLEQLFEKNKAAIDELRGLVSEAHGVLGDLRREVKKAEQIGPAIVSKRLRIETQKAIDGLEGATEIAIEKAAKKVITEFESLEKRLLGADEPGKMSIPEMLDKMGPLYPLLHAVLSGDARIIEDGKEGHYHITTTRSEEG